VVKLPVSADEGSPDAVPFCGVDSLQITCQRRSKNLSAVTAKTPKNGLEITAALRATSFRDFITFRDGLQEAPVEGPS